MKKPKLSKKNSAIIVFLSGTSTSGKTTICKILKNLISDLKIDGTDYAYERLEGHNFEKTFKYFNENKNKFPDILNLVHFLFFTYPALTYSV